MMRKQLLMLAAGLCSTAFAQTTTNVVNADCGRFVLSTQYPNMNYFTQAVFPKPSELVQVKLSSEPVTVCGVKGKLLDEYSWEFSAPSFAVLGQQLSRLFRDYGEFEVYLFGISVSGAAPVKMNLNVNLQKGTLGVTSFDGDDPGMSLLMMFRSNVTGVKIDGGALQPLIFEGKSTQVKFPSSTVKTIDIYNLMNNKGMYESGVGFERVLIDVQNARITFWKKFEFPK